MSSYARRAAAAMGRRAGEELRATGVPTLNPFRRRKELAAAWREGYFAAADSGGSR